MEKNYAEKIIISWSIQLQGRSGSIDCIWWSGKKVSHWTCFFKSEMTQFKFSVGRKTRQVNFKRKKKDCKHKNLLWELTTFLYVVFNIILMVGKNCVCSYLNRSENLIINVWEHYDNHAKCDQWHWNVIFKVFKSQLVKLSTFPPTSYKSNT